MTDTKKYLMHDIIVLVILVILCFVNKTAFPTDTPKGVRTLHLIQYGVAWAF